MGDRAIEREVLGLFLEQAQTFVRRVDHADATERQFLAHALKGSALSIGAFPIADCVGAIEQAPHDRSAIKRLASLVGEASDFIASIDR